LIHCTIQFTGDDVSEVRASQSDIFIILGPNHSKLHLLQTLSRIVPDNEEPSPTTKMIDSRQMASRR
jgi:hypothetical protein